MPRVIFVPKRLKGYDNSPVARDRNILKCTRKRLKKRIVAARHIDIATLDAFCDNCDVYPADERGSTIARTMVIRQDRMHKFVGVRFRVFNDWLNDGKVPRSIYRVKVDTQGQPARCYLYDEAVAIATCLNHHYVTHCNFRHSDVGVIRNIKAAVDLARARNKEIFV